MLLFFYLNEKDKGLKKLFITALLLTNLSAITKEQEEFKYIEPKNNQLLFYTPDNETKISSYCDNYIVYYPKDGYIIPTLRLIGMSLIHPDAPLAQKYIPADVVEVGRADYIKNKKLNPEDRMIKAIKTAWLYFEQTRGDLAGRKLIIRIYNDSVDACNIIYGHGKEMYIKMNEINEGENK